MSYYGWQQPPPPPQQPKKENKTGKRIRNFAIVVILAFAITLAIVVGQRLSDQAISILAGAVCGVGASIPTSLLIIWVSRKQQENNRQPDQTQMMPHQSMYPPVVVVQPNGAQQFPQQRGSIPATLDRAPMDRRFTMVGDAEDWEEVT
jgi:hypothetical protein